MCNAASNSSRAQLILDPYPSLVDPSNPERLAMDPSVRDDGWTDKHDGLFIGDNGVFKICFSL